MEADLLSQEMFPSDTESGYDFELQECSCVVRKMHGASVPSFVSVTSTSGKATVSCTVLRSKGLCEADGSCQCSTADRDSHFSQY